jgi:hypothetical protein
MPPRSDEIYIDDDDDDEDEEKDDVCLKDIRAFDKTAFRPVFA